MALTKGESLAADDTKENEGDRCNTPTRPPPREQWRAAPELDELKEVIGTRAQVLAAIKLQAWLHKHGDEAPPSPATVPRRAAGDGSHPGTPTGAIPAAPPPTASARRRRRLHTPSSGGRGGSQPSSPSSRRSDDECDSLETTPLPRDMAAARLQEASNSSSPRSGEGRETPTWLKSAECLLHSAARDAPEAELLTAAAPQGRTNAASLHGQRLAAMHAAMAVLERTQADAPQPYNPNPNPDPDPDPNPDPNPSPNPSPDPNPNQVSCCGCTSAAASRSTADVKAISS